MKPINLYRGIVISYDELENFDLVNADLVVPYDPIVDEDGNKTVLDGNEYGVYMTDNPNMVNDVYGNVHNDGKPVQGGITIGFQRQPILIPSVGISYEISTQDLNVHKPKIASFLKGHYNNGFQGNEWIADKIPYNNYKVYRIRIGSDILHPAEDINIIDNNIEEAKKEALKNIQMRKNRLVSLVNELSKMTPVQRNNISSLELDVLKAIYGKDGVRYINNDTIDTSNNIGRIKHLMATFYNNENRIINFSVLGYIEDINKKLSKTENSNLFETLEQIVLNDIQNMLDKKNNFVQKKMNEGVEFSTKYFDSKVETMRSILKILLTTKIKDEKQIEIDNLNPQLTPKNKRVLKEQETQKNNDFRYNENAEDNQENIYDEEQEHRMLL
ncbi:MAG: hypothetical protein GX758_03640 [Tenericutes bacterium]|nr:hypothetical protein [Mycoplasmatota bacterium]